MEMTFRWFGENDPIPLQYIRQIPKVTGIVSALYDVPVGDIWPRAKISKLKRIIEAAGLNFSVIESIPIHEDIKLGRSNRDELIDNYCQSIINMGTLGIKTLCYNFMPVFDWFRTNLALENPDGSNSLGYLNKEVIKINPKKNSLELPGWTTPYTKKELNNLLDAYSEINEDDLWSNLEYFLKRVVPIAEEFGVKMGIHPDDPPWSIFGLPRIITNEKALDRVIKIVKSTSNGITFCSASLGLNPNIDLARCIQKFGKIDRIPFVHCRNLKKTGKFDFHESKHPTEFGDIDMYEVIKAYVEIEFKGAVRPDHGRMIWGESGRPGYGLYDRALGAIYIIGLWEGIEKSINTTIVKNGG
ncbi:MAG: mannonate dehydratase [Promethearchaeota archaeon]